jgi:hypothetical protein
LWIDLANRTEPNTALLQDMEAQTTWNFQAIELQNAIYAGMLNPYATGRLIQHMATGFDQMLHAHISLRGDAAYIVSDSKKSGIFTALPAIEVADRYRNFFKRLQVSQSTTSLIKVMSRTFLYGFCLGCPGTMGITPLNRCTQYITDADCYFRDGDIDRWFLNTPWNQAYQKIAILCKDCYAIYHCKVCSSPVRQTYDYEDFMSRASERRCLGCSEFTLANIKRPSLGRLARKFARHVVIADVSI